MYSNAFTLVWIWYGFNLYMGIGESPGKKAKKGWCSPGAQELALELQRAAAATQDEAHAAATGHLVEGPPIEGRGLGDGHMKGLPHITALLDAGQDTLQLGAHLQQQPRWLGPG